MQQRNRITCSCSCGGGNSVFWMMQEPDQTDRGHGHVSTYSCLCVSLRHKESLCVFGTRLHLALGRGAEGGPAAGGGELPAAAASLRSTLISRRLSTGVRQMGHRFVWWRSMRAHPLHIHMWRHGSTVVSRASERHTTHSLPAIASSSGLPVAQFSMP